MKPTLKADDLKQFTGSECIYQHPIARKMVYTEGVRYVAELGGAYWLLDTIAIKTSGCLALVLEPFLVWSMVVDQEKSTARINVTDGNDRKLYCEDITFTDFPLDEITFYVCDNTILLPSEY